MIVREVASRDLDAWAAMRAKLWPDQTPEEHREEIDRLIAFGPPCTVLVAEDGDRLIGFMELAVRSYAEGAPEGPAAYIEGLFVEEEWRRRGVATALLREAEEWARRRGHKWLGSDAVLDNNASHAWHRAAGLAEIERIVIFGKPLG